MQKILLIEDEVDIRVIYAEMLRNSGFEVEEVGDGEGKIIIPKPSRRKPLTAQNEF